MAEASDLPLLVELFVEELPPKTLKKLGAAFADGLAGALRGEGLVSECARVTAFATPRRLAVLVDAVAARSADSAVALKLMPTSVGLDAAGQATPALVKKLASLGADRSVLPTLRRRIDGKSETLFLDRVAAGPALAEGLQRALERAIAQLPIAKVMQYQLVDGWSSVSFVRPAHGLVALHGSEVVQVRVLGLEAGRTTHGHRFEATQVPITIESAASYEAQLRNEGAVIASFEERRSEIARQLSAAATALALTLVDDSDLLDEVTALVERPNVVTCRFDADFLAVPPECLVLTMKANQKYFPLLDGAGKLTNRFLVVSNITPADASRVIEGNERVVRPRLADAKFFFDKDRERTLASRCGELIRVAYFERLGNMDNRVQRVRSIAAQIGGVLGGRLLSEKADLAANLAKADLVTDMVGEFPELQGTMGRYYAANDGLDAEVAAAIGDQYKPRFSGDELPADHLGLTVALADKLESLVGLFAIGKMPSGDRDPHGQRRSGAGIVRMLVERALPIRLSEMIEFCRVPFACETMSKEGRQVLEADQKLHGKRSWGVLSSGLSIDDETGEQVKAFLFERLASLLKDRGYQHAEISAVLALNPDRLDGVVPRMEAVRAFVQLPEAQSLAAANKRVANILKKADEHYEPSIGDAVLVEPAEVALAAAIRRLAPAANAAFEQGDFVNALKIWAAIQRPVDEFFAAVRVNADEPALRVCRLGLLCKLHVEMNRVADLSKLAA